MAPDDENRPGDGQDAPESEDGGTEERPAAEDPSQQEAAADDAGDDDGDTGDADGGGEDADAAAQGGDGNEGDAPDEDDAADGAPEYKVFRAGEDGPIGSKQAKGGGRSGERPEYKVYRSRPSIFRRGEGTLGRAEGEPSEGIRERLSSIRRPRRPGGRPWLRRLLIAAGLWLLISFISFGVSAQIQKGKLSDAAKDALGGGPALLAGQNILILGGDQRTEDSNEPGISPNDPPRADTIMVMHASLTSFRKLSIPRDVQADIPGFGAQKINGAFSITGKTNGDAALMVETVENFLGIDIDHLIIVDFEGFADFIDALGGVTIDVPEVKGRPDNKAVVCGDISGGKRNGGVSLKLKPGKITLESQKALAYARLRKNNCAPGEDDRDRAARQQQVLNGIKSRITSPVRFPINFIKGPLIGWAAPKAFISDMGGATLPQLAIAAIFGGSGKENVLKPSTTIGGNLIIPGSECTAAVKLLTGGPPDRDPICSPG